MSGHNVRTQCGNVAMWQCTVEYSAVQCSTVQYSTVQYSTVQYSTVQYSTVQYKLHIPLCVVPVHSTRFSKGKLNSPLNVFAYLI